MDYEALLDRILRRVDAEAYLALADQVDPSQRAALEEIGRALAAPVVDADALCRRVRELHALGRIDEVNLHSALHVIEAHPAVGRLDRAAEHVARQEMAAIRAGGPRLQANLASVERHRGVIAWQQGQVDIALDYFSRAFERQRSAGNLSNVLACLLRMDDLAAARDLLAQVRTAFPPAMIASLDGMIAADPDLAPLRQELTV